MTKSQSVQTAYNWAWNVSNDRKGLAVEIFCAKQVLRAIDSSEDSPEVAYDALAVILKEWKGRRKDYLERPIKRLARALHLGEESDSDS